MVSSRAERLQKQRIIPQDFSAKYLDVNRIADLTSAAFPEVGLGATDLMFFVGDVLQTGGQRRLALFGNGNVSGYSALGDGRLYCKEGPARLESATVPRTGGVL